MTSPLISRIKPSNGPIRGGTRVKVYGKGLMEGDKILFGWTICPIQVNSSVSYIITPEANYYGETPLTIIRGMSHYRTKVYFRYTSGRSRRHSRVYKNEIRNHSYVGRVISDRGIYRNQEDR